MSSTDAPGENGSVDEQLTTKKSKIASRLIVGIVVLLGLLLLGGAYVTHGLSWSIYVPIYRGLLNSIPNPPGTVQEGGWTKLIPEEPCGMRSYRVDQGQSGLESFYTTTLLDDGWSLAQRYSQKPRATNVSFDYIGRTELVFKRHMYWLSINTVVFTDAAGNPTRRAEVSLMVCRDKEWKNLGH